MARVRPEVTSVDGVASPSRKQGVQVAQGLCAWVEWVVRGDDGQPADLTLVGVEAARSSGSSAAGPAGSVVLRAIECLSRTSAVKPTVVEAEAVDPARGLVRAKLTPALVALAGVYDLEWAVYNPVGAMEFAAAGSLIVNRGLSGESTGAAPPTVAELRLHLRDAGPEDNYLLDSVEFDLAELAACLERPVRLWNETLEFVYPRYTTQSFPYRSRWLDAAAGYLMVLAGHNYDRNLQQYQAGGTAMKDKDKGPLYQQKGQAILAEYRQWVVTRKGQLNLESAYGGTSERGRY